MLLLQPAGFRTFREVLSHARVMARIRSCLELLELALRIRPHGLGGILPNIVLRPLFQMGSLKLWRYEVLHSQT
jgi:hypothetical protein